MKLIRTICSICLAVVCALGWFSMLREGSSLNAEYTSYLQQAEDDADRGLYQKAAQSYQNALDLQGDPETRQKLLEVTRMGYEEGSIERRDYLNALQDACDAEPENTSCWEARLELLCQNQNYRDARSVLRAAGNAHVTSPRMVELADQVNYSYTEQGRAYSEVLVSPSGYSTVHREDKWGMLRPDGDEEYECDYTYVGPYGDGSAILLCSEERNSVFDSQNVVQANLSWKGETARAGGDGLLPLSDGNGWRYFSTDSGSYLEGTYNDASSFQNGRALVKAEGGWSFLTADGERTETGFREVKLYPSGEYTFGGRIVAADQSGYGLFDDKGERKGELTAVDMDIYMGGPVAFQASNGRWGFADEDGSVLVEPQYEMAKSFSHGLAAVFDGEAWGFINMDQRWVIPAQYADAGYFTSGGFCMVSDMGENYHSITLRFP